MSSEIAEKLVKALDNRGLLNQMVQWEPKVREIEEINTERKNEALKLIDNELKEVREAAKLCREFAIDFVGSAFDEDILILRISKVKIAIGKIAQLYNQLKIKD